MTLEEFKAHLEPLGNMVKRVREEKGGRYSKPSFHVRLSNDTGFYVERDALSPPIVALFIDFYYRTRNDAWIPLIRKLDPEIGKDYETREEKRDRHLKERKKIEDYFRNYKGVEMDWEMDYPYRVTVHCNDRSREYYFSGNDDLIGLIDLFICFYSQGDHNLHQVKK